MRKDVHRKLTQKQWTFSHKGFSHYSLIVIGFQCLNSIAYRSERQNYIVCSYTFRPKASEGRRNSQKRAEFKGNNRLSE